METEQRSTTHGIRWHWVILTLIWFCVTTLAGLSLMVYAVFDLAARRQEQRIGFLLVLVGGLPYIIPWLYRKYRQRKLKNSNTDIGL